MVGTTALTTTEPRECLLYKIYEPTGVQHVLNSEFQSDIISYKLLSSIVLRDILNYLTSLSLVYYKTT